MALIIEDGTAKTDSQSYATLAQLVAFAASRAITLPATDAAKEALLLAAMDYIETLNFVGTRYTFAQALSWPRAGATVDQWLLYVTDIPVGLVNAQLQLAVDSMTTSLLPNVTASETVGAVIEKTVVGAVSVKYAAPQASLGSGMGVTAAGAVLSRARALLRPLIKGMGQVRVGRG